MREAIKYGIKHGPILNYGKKHHPDWMYLREALQLPSTAIARRWELKASAAIVARGEMTTVILGAGKLPSSGGGGRGAGDMYTTGWGWRWRGQGC